MEGQGQCRVAKSNEQAAEEARGDVWQNVEWIRNHYQFIVGKVGADSRTAQMVRESVERLHRELNAPRR